MKVFLIGLLWATCLWVGEAQAQAKKSPPATVVAVRTALEKQARAWSTGRLEEFMSFYWNSDSLVWVNRTGVQKGWYPTWEMYARDYEDRSLMGRFTYEILCVRPLGSDAASTTLRWQVESENGPSFQGVSTQLWRRIKNRWVILLEHAS